MCSTFTSLFDQGITKGKGKGKGEEKGEPKQKEREEGVSSQRSRNIDVPSEVVGRDYTVLLAYRGRLFRVCQF